MTTINVNLDTIKVILILSLKELELNKLQSLVLN